MYISIIFIIFLCLSTMIHHAMLKAEIKKYHPPGKLVEVEGHKIHIAGSGSGLPTVVMTCGSGAPCAITEFYPIAAKLSGIARVCVYERPGYGWRESQQSLLELSSNSKQVVIGNSNHITILHEHWKELVRGIEELLHFKLD